MKQYRPIASLLLLALLLPLVFSPAASAEPAASAPVDPYIWRVIEREGNAEILVILKEQADVSGAFLLETKEEKGWFVYQQLTDVAERTQPALRAYLEREGAFYRSYWIRNMIQVSADAELVRELALRPEVDHVEYLYPAYPDPVYSSPFQTVEPVEKETPEAIEWNILRVNADDAWGLGYTGSGAVVGDLDTGVQWDHPALVNAYRPQIPGAPGRHDYNWWDGPNGSSTPVDYGNHGTHTMGTIVGDDGADNQIGMAPGAHWIACAGLGANATPIDCFQFFLAPTQLDGSNPRPDLAPHVINNSWSSASDYHDIIQVLYAAGIYYAKSAGNEGSGCSTITNPGQWAEVTATAAFAQGDTIASFSSRGPETIGHDIVMKPDIAAPGSGVRSSMPGGTYGGMSGTSMACPHVTGAVALLISANPALAGQIDVMQMILKQTAEPVIDSQCPPYVDHPNDVWGWGILDAHAAVVMAEGMGLGGIAGLVYDSSTMAPIPDAAITFADASTGWPLHDTSEADGTYDRHLPAATYNISATHYGYLPGYVPGVVVQDGLTTSQDIPLDTAPIWTVSGLVTETHTGDPLAAHVIFEETPVTTDTNPATGIYSADVAQGAWWMHVSSPGHAWAERLVTVDQDLNENFSLSAIDNYYMKAGDGPCDPVFDWRDASGGTSYCLGDDAAQYVNLPAPFTFYGADYSACYIGSNGHITFGSGWSKWSGPIPDPALPNNGIYAFSTDLNPAGCSQGTIYAEFQENRYYVVQFDQVEHYPSGNPETFEIILDYETGDITIQFLTVSEPSEAVAGVENSDGSEATQYAYGDPALITDSVRVDFYPAFGTPPPSGGPGNLQGTVTDDGTGLPIEGATVWLTAFSGGATYTATTDAAGFYDTVRCTDWYSATASAPGYAPSDPVQVTVLSGTLTTQDFALVEQDNPEIVVTPAFFDVIVAAGGALSATLTVENVGDADLAFELVETPAVDWLAASPVSGTVAPSDSLAIDVTFDAASLAPGAYSTTLEVQSNDPFQPVVGVPVTLTVQCDPVHDVQVSWAPVTPTVGVTVTFTAAASGTEPIFYEWDFGDGSGATGPVVTHAYAAPMAYTMAVTITNCESAVVTERHVITVTSWQVYLPVMVKE
ncbi:MAG: S8 family serine peptidase [Anaerolineae bacterium]|nr:S8 family serine peptidase [Anaerolineae bacterium]